MIFMKELLDILAEYVNDGIHVIDSEGKTIIYNHVMEELEGQNREDVIGRKLLEVFPSLDENTSTLCRTIKTKEQIIDRYQSYINRKGYNITTVNTTIPILKDGEVQGAVELSKDFTKIKELYDKIINMYDANTLEDSHKDQFGFDRIIGYSPQFLRVVETSKKAAATNSSLLIYGETGTGKEVLTRCIHNESDRSSGPFIAVNCAALPEALLEGILFGTVKGGFTGAVDRPGLFEQAMGGTILLDEINSMSTQLQAKLLRVLQEGYVRRVGDVKDIKIDVRIIATTNEEPMSAIEKVRLRKDLYYRLSVVNITIPPLRDRKEDIPLFIKEFINKNNKELRKEVWDVSKDVYDAFMSYNWPGNVRELKNYIEGGMNIVSGHVLNRSDFSEQVQEQLFDKNISDTACGTTMFDYNVSLDEYMEEVEKNILIKALTKCDNNISETARLLRIKRQTLQHKLKKYNI